MNDEHASRDFERLERPLDAAVRAALAEPVPEDAVERVKTQARQLAADTAFARLASMRRQSRRISRPIAASLAVAASLLVIVTAVALLLDQSGSQAFAQMIEMVKAANTVQFSATIKFGHQPQTTSQTYLAGNRLRIEQFDGAVVSIVDADRQQGLVLQMYDKRFERVRFDAGMARMPVNPIDKLRQVKSDDAEPIGEEVLDGRRTRVYRLSKIDLLELQGNDEMMVWIDVESELPAKIVIRDADPKHLLEVRLENFVWNEPLDPQLFSLDVPEGFEQTVVTEPADVKEVEPVELDTAPSFVDGVLRDRVPARILWDPDGTRITAVMRDPESTPLLEQQPYQLRQWDVPTGWLLWSEDVAGASWVAATADGQLLANVIGYEVQLRDAATGKITGTWATKEPLSPLAFSPDGKVLAAGVTEWGPYGGRGGELAGGVEFWDVKRATVVQSIADDKPTTFLRYSVDGQSLVTSSNEGPVKLWNAATGELSRVFPGRGRVAISPDGRTIAFPSASPLTDRSVGRVDLHNLVDGSLVRTFTSEPGPSASWLLALEFSPDGRRLATSDWNGTVTVWDVATGQRLHTITDHEAGVLSVAFSPDGTTLATGSEDKTLRLWTLRED